MWLTVNTNLQTILMVMVVEQSSLVLNFLGSSWTVFLISWDSDIISTVPEHLVDWTPRRNIRSQLTVAANTLKNYSSNTRNPVVLRNHPRHHRYCFLDRNCTVYWMRWRPKSLQRSNASDSQKKNRIPSSPSKYGPRMKISTSYAESERQRHSSQNL